ncbi:hypothetical protein ACFX2K_045647 [Malus domestica]
MGVACLLTTECQIRRCGPHCTIHKSRHLRLQYVARRCSVVATHKAPAGRCNIFPQQIANSSVLEAKPSSLQSLSTRYDLRVCYQCFRHCVFLWTILPLKQTQLFPLLPLLQNVNFCWF